MMSLPRVFLSHSTQDNVWCRPFVAALQAVGYDLFFDEQGLTGSVQWVNTLQSELQAREIFIIALTPTAWASRWVQEEIQLAIATRIATRRTIIPIRLEPTQVEGFLLTRQWVDAVGQDSASVARQVIALLQSAVVVPPPPKVRQIVPAPQLVPPIMQNLGYSGLIIDGVMVVLPPLCDVPAGPFLLGTDPHREPQFAESEDRQRVVTVSAFQMAKYPVTVLEYYYAIQSGALREPVGWERQYPRPNHPVVQISWKSALAYVAWLRDVTGDAWRLPTEEEWQKAARGTDGRIFPWGNQWDPRLANTEQSGIGDTTPVGAYPAGASPYGILDMAGNVNEWCGQPPESLQLRPDPYGESEAVSRGYLVGGSWDDSPAMARTAHRSQLFIGERSDDTGFRLVKQAAV